MFNINENHLFGKNAAITQLKCEKNKQLFAQAQPDTIIIHYTAGKDAASSANYLCKPEVKASAHLVIGRDGSVFQLVPFNTIAWHAGKSAYNGRIGFNQFSIGIEIDNAGILEKSGSEYVAWFGKPYPENEVIKAIHRNESKEKYWHCFTEIQIEKVEEICQAIMNKYSSIQHILGHEEISAGRKTDPGPAFPLDKIRDRLMQERDSESSIYENKEGFVDVDSLNIREFPSVQSEIINAPLTKNQKVKIVQKNQNWYQVKTEIEGWVSAEYIRFDKES